MLMLVLKLGYRNSFRLLEGESLEECWIHWTIFLQMLKSFSLFQSQELEVVYTHEKFHTSTFPMVFNLSWKNVFFITCKLQEKKRFKWVSRTALQETNKSYRLLSNYSRAHINRLSWWMVFSQNEAFGQARFTVVSRVEHTKEAKTADSGHVLSLPAGSPLLARNKLSARKSSLTLVAC